MILKTGLALIGLIAGMNHFAFAQTLIPRNDQLAIDAIFQEQHVHDSGLDIHLLAATLETQQRFDFLVRWVLPSDSHRSLRVSCGYRCIAVLATDDLATDDLATDDSQPPSFSFGDDGRIVSPVLDLFDAAIKLGRLNELTMAVEQIKAIGRKEQTKRDALLACLTLLDPNTRDPEEKVAAFFSNVLDDPENLSECRDAVLICLHLCSTSERSSEESREIAFEVIERIKQLYKTVVDRRSWQQHVWALSAELAQQAEVTKTNNIEDVVESEKDAELSGWHLATRTRSIEHGLGFPKSRWSLQPGSAINLSSHGDDYYYLTTPLMGDYNVEADISNIGYRDSQLMVGGVWVAAISDHQTVGIGNLRGERFRQPFSPPLTDSFRFETIHCRMNVQENHLTTFFNGRQVDSRDLGQTPDPWVAIRSSYMYDGGAANLRITGTPTIPETIDLSANPDLPTWYEYFHVAEQGKLKDWRYEADPKDESGGVKVPHIVGLRDTQLPPGSNQESLLVYGRPMFENGTIEYEFFYRENEFEAHPTLGRTCFLLKPEGIALHVLSDGLYEQTNLRPDNRSSYGGRPMTLLNEQWNRVRVTKRDQTIAIEVNDTEVFKRDAAAEPSPVFGLFHYRDRSEARVKNVRWTGDWPKKLPSVDDQELAGMDDVLKEHRAAHMKDEMAYRFDATTLTSNRLRVRQGVLGSHIQALDSGLLINRPAEKGYRNAQVSPNLSLHGDFDITIRFDEFLSRTADGMVGTLMLEAEVVDPEDPTNKDLISLQRKIDIEGRPIMQCLHMITIAGSERRHYFNHTIVEADAGRMRLSRRGNEAFYQFAENDSDQFRMIGKVEYATGDVVDGELLFGTQIQGETGFTKVRVTDLTIRAEQIEGLAYEDLDERLVILNDDAEQLAESFEFDLAATPPPSTEFYRWNDRSPWTPGERGQRIVSQGTDRWTSAGIAYLHSFEGDYDIAIDFEPVELAIPKASGNTQISLQVETADAKQTQTSTIFSRVPSGATIAEAQIRTRNTEGKISYRNLSQVEMNQVDRLRTARRGRRVYFIAASRVNNEERIIDYVDAGDESVLRGGSKILLHTGGDGRSSKMVVQRVHVRAERIQGVSRGNVSAATNANGDTAVKAAPMAAPARQTPRIPARLPPYTPPKRSWLQSFWDLF